MLKLYVLIRDDISEAQQAVQAGHAVAELMQEMTTDELAEWKHDGGGTLIYLSVQNIYYWQSVLEDGGFKHSVFYEPDYYIPGTGRGAPRDIQGTHTAIAVAPSWLCQYVLFKGLPLALQPKPKKRWWQR